MLIFLLVHKLQIREHLSFRGGIQIFVSPFFLNIATTSEVLWKQVSHLPYHKSMDIKNRMMVHFTLSEKQNITGSNNKVGFTNLMPIRVQL